MKISILTIIDFQTTEMECSGGIWIQKIERINDYGLNGPPVCIPGCEYNHECHRGNVCDQIDNTCKPVTCDTIHHHSRNAVRLKMTTKTPRTYNIFQLSVFIFTLF